MYVIRKWHLKVGCEFRVEKSTKKLWSASCKNSSDENPCCWYVQVIEKKPYTFWVITRYNGDHTCLVRVINNVHRNLSSKHIAPQILHLIDDDPETHVSTIIQEVQERFHSGCSYKKGWYARKAAVELKYGDWVSTFNILPRYMQAVEDVNPGTIVEWKHRRSTDGDVKIFGYLFWAFKPCIEGFKYCRPVISIDGTFLRGAYRGVMLIASGWDANDHVFPLAFAIVDTESAQSWGWFLRLLRHHVVLDRFVCLISDRHAGILSSISSQPEWQEPLAVHRLCLRHVRANFSVTFKSKELKRLMYKAGIELKTEKFAEVMNEIRGINAEAYTWLMSIGPERWSLAYDGGFRYNCVSTNLSESFNSVLKKTRALPFKALVEMSFGKIVRYFHDHRVEAANCKRPFPPRVWRKYNDMQTKARRYAVTPYNEQSGIFSVKTPLRAAGKGNNFYTVNLMNRSCSCTKWNTFGLPCSHTIAVCHNRGMSPSDFVLPIYTRAFYRKIYECDFFPVLNESFWREAPFRLEHYKPFMKGNRPGRLRSTRYRGEMDYRTPGSPRRCGNCHMPGHNRKNCPGTHFDDDD